MYSFPVVFFLAALTLVGISTSADDNKDEDKENRARSEHAREARAHDSTLEVHFFDNGKVLVRGAKVTAVSGNTVNAVTAWDAVSLSWGVNVLPDTEINRRFGGRSSVSEISVGDFISFQGALLYTSAFPIMVNAKVIKNWSVQKKNASFNGKVKSVDSVNSKFVLSSERAEITVMVSTTTLFKKGDGTGVFSDVAVGGRVLAKGLYNSQLMQLSADEVKIYSPEAIPTTVEGIIKSIAGTTLPASMVVTSDGKDYTVNIATDTSVLNKRWLRATLASFAPGNKVRVYGTVNAGLIVDATVIRNVSL